jgi:serine/threonine protein kinase
VCVVGWVHSVVHFILHLTLPTTPIPQIEESQCRALFKQIIAGVAHIHSRQICHLDLSLENVLLCEGASVAKICDFGQAQFLFGHVGMGHVRSVREWGGDAASDAGGTEERHTTGVCECVCV